MNSAIPHDGRKTGEMLARHRRQHTYVLHDGAKARARSIDYRPPPSPTPTAKGTSACMRRARLPDVTRDDRGSLVVGPKNDRGLCRWWGRALEAKERQDKQQGGHE